MKKGTSACAADVSCYLCTTRILIKSVNGDACMKGTITEKYENRYKIIIIKKNNPNVSFIFKVRF